MQENYIVCRCEDVTLQSVESCIDDDGALDLPEAKRRLRVGMGPCQGRVCGPMLRSIFGESAVGSLERNAVLRPVLLADIAATVSDAGQEQP
ncbi:(2Fe-2S)-binding protein [Brevibacterium oceani]|uniref:(2Fe-2S)-binding protein n=1 Tax=Brevibacterium oceani TaxID=358099 RepID=UPI003CCE98F9